MFQIIKLVAFIGLAIWLFFSYTQPTWMETEQVMEDIEKHTEALMEVSAFNQNIIDLMARQENINKADLDRMDILIPTELDETGVMADIQAIVEGRNARLLQVGASDWNTVSGGGSASAEAVGLQDPEHLTKDITISIEGTYQQLKQILADLERSLVLLEVTGITFAAVEGDIVGYSLVIRINQVK